MCDVHRKAQSVEHFMYIGSVIFVVINRHEFPSSAMLMRALHRYVGLLIVFEMLLMCMASQGILARKLTRCPTPIFIARVEEAVYAGQRRKNHGNASTL